MGMVIDDRCYGERRSLEGQVSLSRKTQFSKTLMEKMKAVG